MTMESMPCMRKSRASISPAGPAPMIPTCVRMRCLPASECPSYRSIGSVGQMDDCRKDLDIKRRGSSSWNAIARHARLVVPIGIAELGFEIALLALDDAEMQHQRQDHRRDHHPVGRKQNGKAEECRCAADIHRIAQPRENAGTDDCVRWLPRLDVRPGGQKGAPSDD